MSKYKDVNEVIEKVIKPRLDLECEKLGIPPSFIKDINAVYPKPMEFDSLCEPVERDGKVEGVRIRITVEADNPRVALRHFWHEMWHAKEYYEGRKFSEFRASLYSWKRLLQELLHL